MEKQRVQSLFCGTLCVISILSISPSFCANKCWYLHVWLPAMKRLPRAAGEYSSLNRPYIDQHFCLFKGLRDTCLLSAQLLLRATELAHSSWRNKNLGSSTAYTNHSVSSLSSHRQKLDQCWMTESWATIMISSSNPPQHMIMWLFQSVKHCLSDSSITYQRNVWAVSLKESSEFLFVFLLFLLKKV